VGSAAPLPILLPPRLHLARREDVVHWRSRFSAADLVEVCGVPVTTLARSGFDLGRTSRFLDSSVAALDTFARQTGVDLTIVRGYAARRPRSAFVGRTPVLSPGADRSPTSGAPHPRDW
jgi:hypothetical protein